MADKTITLTADAYNALTAHKRNDESFSELLLRICSHKENLKRFIENRADWCSTVDKKDADRRMEEHLANRQRDREGVDARMRKLWGDERVDQMFSDRD
jgi:predicted CopG family antitoxin